MSWYEFEGFGVERKQRSVLNTMCHTDGRGDDQYEPRLIWVPAGPGSVHGKCMTPEDYHAALEKAKARPDAVTKDTNPKDAVGTKKVSLRSVLPMRVLAGVALALLEGALKYGRFNYRRAGVRFSVYLDAVARHLDAFQEGQDIDPHSGLHHIDKAIAGLMVLRDGILQGNATDDREPCDRMGTWVEEANARAAAMIEKHEKGV